MYTWNNFIHLVKLHTCIYIVLICLYIYQGINKVTALHNSQEHGSSDANIRSNEEKPYDQKSVKELRRHFSVSLKMMCYMHLCIHIFT